MQIFIESAGQATAEVRRTDIKECRGNYWMQHRDDEKQVMAWNWVPLKATPVFSPHRRCPDIIIRINGVLEKLKTLGWVKIKSECSWLKDHHQSTRHWKDMHHIIWIYLQSLVWYFQNEILLLSCYNFFVSFLCCALWTFPLVISLRFIAMYRYCGQYSI